MFWIDFIGPNKKIQCFAQYVSGVLELANISFQGSQLYISSQLHAHLAQAA